MDSEISRIIYTGIGEISPSKSRDKLTITITTFSLSCYSYLYYIINIFVFRFEDGYKQMWVNNGNSLSKIYAGTGALNQV